MQTTTAADIAAYLRELGMVRELIGAGSPEDSGAPESPGSAEGTAVPLSAVATDADAGPGDLAWSRRPGAAASFGGSLLICSAEAAGELSGTAPLSEAGRLVIVCARPRLAMALVVGRFFAHLAADGPPVYADPATARLVDEMRAWVKNAVVGCNLGIEPLATIGCSGMGYERDDQGRLVPFPQLGRVVLEDDVHVAAQAMIQRGAIGDTVVRRGAKIGPHVNVGHNVEVGEDVLIAGHAQVGGGARIGKGAVVWQSAAIANGVTVGEGAVIGMGAMIRADVGAGEVWVGNPGRRLR
jgi:acetyltransferase-like isoleucine patch superfamily enzyme